MEIFFSGPMFALASAVAPSSCADGVHCLKVAVGNLTFNCRQAGPAMGEASAGNVMLLHGFPEWSSMFVPLMRRLADRGYQSVACNQRGYSSGARPARVTDYNYNTLADDVWALAAAFNFTSGGAKFHLVGHDHGGVLGWVVAASPRGAASLRSYTSLSIPHPAAFSAGLFGAAADEKQQDASQYFSIFTLNASASLHGSVLYHTMGATTSDADMGDAFPDATSFQKAVWWYNGAFDASVLAAPPVISAWELTKRGSFASAAMRALFGGTPRPGIAAGHSPGPVGMPALYVCGGSDYAILCNRPYALKTVDYCAAATYSYLEVDCGHSLLSCAKPDETEKVTAAIIAHLEAAGHEGGDSAYAYS